MLESEVTLPAIKQVQTTKEQLQQLADNYKNLVVTPETVKEADKARLVLYRERIAIQNIEKENNDILNNFKKANAKKADELIAIIEPLEKDLKAKIDAITAEEKRKKEEEAQKERDRISAIKGSISVLEARIPMIRTIKSVEELDKIALEVSVKENSFSEFNEEGNAMVKSVLTAIEARKIVLADEKALADKQALDAEEEMKANMAAAEQAKFDQPETKEVIFETKQHGDKVVDMPTTASNPSPFGHKQNLYDTFKSTPNNQISDRFKYSGFEFNIDLKLPAEERTKIINFIKEVIDELPM